MKFSNVVIEEMAYYLPENILTSEAIESQLNSVYEKLKLPHGRLELMTGITERRTWEIGTRPSDLSTQAALKLFAKNNTNRNDIDLLIHSSVCRDFLEPATASVVHGQLELKEDCTIFDLSNACLGMMNSFVVAANMIERKQIKKALIVSGENSGPLLQQTIDLLLNDKTLTRKTIKKYIANLTIGSAAVAYLISHSDDVPHGHKILGGAVMTDSSANKLCQGSGDTNGLMMETDSEALLKVGVTLAKKTWDKTKNNLNWNNEDIDWAIGHQVGSAHERLTMQTLELENTNTWTTYQTLGNTGSAALPITLAKLTEEQGKLKKGDKLALLGIGSGLSSIMLGVEW